MASEYTSSFNVGDVIFNNTWNSKWSYWSNGWIYSNKTDSITSGSAINGRSGKVIVAIGESDSGHGADVSLTGGSTSALTRSRGGAIHLNSGASQTSDGSGVSGNIGIRSADSAASGGSGDVSALTGTSATDVEFSQK